MSDIYHKHTKKRSRKHHSTCDLIADLWKDSARMRNCFIHSRKPFGCFLNFFRIRERENIGVKSETMKAEEDAILAKLMTEYAEEEGRKYNALNDQLQVVPAPEVPANVEKRLLELIDKKLQY